MLSRVLSSGCTKADLALINSPLNFLTSSILCLADYTDKCLALPEIEYFPLWFSEGSRKSSTKPTGVNFGTHIVFTTPLFLSFLICSYTAILDDYIKGNA